VSSSQRLISITLTPRRRITRKFYDIFSPERAYSMQYLTH